MYIREERQTCKLTNARGRRQETKREGEREERERGGGLRGAERDMTEALGSLFRFLSARDPSSPLLDDTMWRLTLCCVSVFRSTHSFNSSCLLCSSVMFSLSLYTFSALWLCKSFVSMLHAPMRWKSRSYRSTRSSSGGACVVNKKM